MPGVLCAGGLATAVATTATAAGPPPTAGAHCPVWHAIAVAGQVGTVVYDPQTKQDKPANPHTGRLRGGPFIAVTDATVRYGHNTYRVGKDTEFGLGCYGQSAARPRDLDPSLLLNTGHVVLKTSAAHPGAIMMREALMNPVGHVAQEITVDRQQSTKGVGTLHMQSTGPAVDITPEVGPGAGHCIYHRAIRATSRWNMARQDYDFKVTVLA